MRAEAAGWEVRNDFGAVLFLPDDGIALEALEALGEALHVTPRRRVDQSRVMQRDTVGVSNTRRERLCEYREG
jgi:hypothetical protein